MNVPSHPDEWQRLKVLEELAVTDHMPDAAVDQITAHAREWFKVPVCLVTLIEAERQVIVSRQGLEITETPRHISFCTHTILIDEVLVVTDTHHDGRFSSNPFVASEPHVRFYAGAPLIYQGEIRLGSLCLIDFRPRTFSRAEQGELTRLAEHVVSVLIRRAYGLPVPDMTAALAD